MTGKVVIRQLWDEERQKAPTVHDVDKSVFTNKKIWKHDNKKYITYCGSSDEKPYKKLKEVTWKNLTENYSYRIPIQYVRKSETQKKRIVDYSQLIHDLYSFKEKSEKYGGGGYYNVYILGGQKPPIRYILQAWIAKAKHNT